LPAQRRAAILAIAAEEFAAHGYQGTSYNRLLARLGIGKSSAYHYFEDKADLFRTVIIDRYTVFFAGVAALPLPEKKRDFWPFVGALNLRGFRFMLEDPTSAALMECLRREASNFDRILANDALLATIDEYHRDILIVGQRLGAVRTDATLEHLSFLSRMLASASDQMFVAEYRRDGAAKVKRRLQAIASEWTEAFRRLFEPKTRRVNGQLRPVATHKSEKGASA
jgi:AcrR family transcriptional regulator